jgi:hypothetical protein
MRGGRYIVLAALALLGGLAVLWWHANFEKVPSRDWVGPSGEARWRDFLAAERLVQRMGGIARELQAFPGADQINPGATLLLPHRRQALDAGRIEDILRWVQRGGHLVAEAELLGVDDPLFDRIGLARRVDTGPVQPLRIEVAKGRALAVAMGSRTVFDVSARDLRLLGGTQQAARLASFAHGRGLITVAASLSFAHNRNIGENDHAELLWHLVTMGAARELQVYFKPERLSLWGFLKEHAAPALAAGGLLLALWLWSIMPRFGPVTPDAPPGRRRLLDHLRASGRYFWVKGLRSRLVVAARDSALRRIARAQPDFATATQSERTQRLASLTGMSAEESQRFLTAAGAQRGADFIKLAQQAQRVHNALEKGAKSK